MPSNLHKAAESILQQNIPGLEYDHEVLSDGTLLLTGPVKEKSTDLFSILKHNAGESGLCLSNPLIIDPKTDRLVHRIAIPYIQWARPSRLRTLLAESTNQPIPDHASIRMIKDIPEEATVYHYGQDGSLSLFLERQTAVFAVQLFPGSLIPFDMVTAHERLQSAGRVLLSRSGLSLKPYSFHMLRETASSFFSVERAVDLPTPIDRAHFKKLEYDMLRIAEEDRNIITALLSPQIPPSFLGNWGDIKP